MTPLDAALAYAARGWRVVPILPGEKRPAMNDWVEQATKDVNTVRQWWFGGRKEPYGVGIVTGAGSGVWVLDVDPIHGGDETLFDLIRQHGDLPPTVRALTPSGGEHIFFRMPDGWNPGTGAGKLGPGLDIRAEGGQVVAPPTDGREWQADYGPDEISVADAPGWLLELLRTPPPQPRRVITSDTSDLPGSRWAAQTTWPQLLEPDGATLQRTDRAGVEYWVRPGKDERDGTSATLYHNGNDCLRVFSSNWPGLDEGQHYTKLGYLAATRFGGDHQAAARWCRGQVEWGLLAGTRATPIYEESPVEPEPDEPLIANRIDWATFWTRERDERPWLVEPFIVRGRAHALYAPAKQGKSYFLLWVLALASLGKPVLDRPGGDPLTVLYVDLEMTDDDVYLRLLEFGHEGTLFPHLHYHVMPPIPALDSVEGGQLIAAEARRVNADLVVIDTMSRAIQGGENDADTILAYARHTTSILKRAGIASLRLDHAGKVLAQGQRGSSAKNDDVDIVWQQTLTDDGLVLKATHRRLSWVPAELVIDRSKTPDGVVSFTMKSGGGYPEGTKAAVQFLTDGGIDTAGGLNKVWDRVRELPGRPTRELVRQALKSMAETVPDLLGTGAEKPDLAQPTARGDETCSDLPGTAYGTGRHGFVSPRAAGAVPKERHSAQTVPTTESDPVDNPLREEWF